MHGHVSHEQFLAGIGSFLGWYYVCLAVLNGIAAYYCWHTLHRSRTALFLLAIAVGFLIIAPLAFFGDPQLIGWISIPDGIKQAVNAQFSKAPVYTLGTLGVLLFMFWFRKFFSQPLIAWLMFVGSMLLMGLSMTDENFAAIVTKPDNVPIVGMVFLLGFFTWLATYRAVQNDERMEQGLEPLEALDKDKVLVWPDLVYTEMICMVVLTAVLILWAIGLQAPLEESASSVKTPNPSKAPWYFLGLQEMLVYFDPWMAGVVLPSLVIVGLMAVPFLDYNKEGNGYYTIKQRKFAYLVFQFGFLELWVVLIILGTFLRGPNWNFFGPFEPWDPHKVEALNNRDLSQYFWNDLLGAALPVAPSGANKILQLGYILLRESPGIVLVALYLLVLPPLLAVTVFRKMFIRMGVIRYIVMVNLLLIMAMLPIKMMLRWTINLKYLISIPEYFLNL